LRGEAGIGRKRKDISFQEARARFESWLEINRRTHTVQSYKEALNRLSKAFDGRKLSQITAAELERYKESRVIGGRGKMSTNRELAVLSSLLNRCREWDVFEFCQGERENAASARRTKRFQENRGRVRF
jgi:site-specific recombinase XerD